MATINFFLQSKNNPAGIYVRLRDGALVDAKAKTKLAINPNEWSAKKNQPKNLKDEHFKALNNALNKFKTDLLNHFNANVNNQPINSQWLKDFISPPTVAQEIPNTLVEYFDFYLIDKKHDLKKQSVTKLNVIKHLIEKFQVNRKRKYFVQEVDDQFKNDFLQYCAESNYAQNTIARSFRFIKTICYHAETNGIAVSPKLKKITLKNQKVDKIYLDKRELRLVEKVKLEHDYLNNARDWLLISCETGQRVSDFLKFTKKLIRYEKKKPLIEFTQVKTGTIMTVPLSKKVMAILTRRKGEFPRQISDQKYNEYVKDVCRIAGLTEPTKGSIQNPETGRKESGTYPKWRLVSSHIGRRSFATNNYGHIPTSLLIGATGHSTEKMFLEYIGKTDTQKAMQLADYF